MNLFLSNICWVYNCNKENFIVIVMKFYESHFEEYIIKSNKENIHPKMNTIYNKMPVLFQDLKNLIFYGPNGTGKYTQMLKTIQKYSPTDLKYEKKISITYNKQQYFFKISDIHYEIDMSLLGCNSKLLWHEIYLQIVDIILAKSEKSGIIVCKFFHEIHNELLENFYSYMQKNYLSVLDLKFILITEEYSFIPNNILNCCELINISRPSKSTYIKCIKTKLPSNLKTENITNIKNLYVYNEDLMLPYKIICNKILYNLININELQFIKFRDIVYDIFIYNLDISDCIWYILSSLFQQNKLKQEHLSDVLLKTYRFFQYYNNNYRPIYHVEGYFYYLVKLIHKF